MNENISIKNWDVNDRPREKMLAKGIISLSDAELLAILIGSGSTKESAVDLCKRILNSVDNNLHELGKLQLAELQKFHGIGEAKAISIMAALELGRRRKISDVLEKKTIQSSEDAFGIFQPLLGDINHEEFWVLLLNSANKIIDKVKISQGGISGTIVDVRLILQPAIIKSASAIIVCHNHPSGNTEPSNEDKKITEKIKAAAEIFNIRFLDHIIIGDKKYFSFSDHGI
jgi:DNA repair protein RadC